MKVEEHIRDKTDTLILLGCNGRGECERKIGNFKNKLHSIKKLDIIHFPYATKLSRQWKTKERLTSKEGNTFCYRIGCLPRQLASQLLHDAHSCGNTCQALPGPGDENIPCPN